MVKLDDIAEKALSRLLHPAPHSATSAFLLKRCVRMRYFTRPDDTEGDQTG